MRIDMCIGMLIEICTDKHIGMHMHMCGNVYMDARIERCIEPSIEHSIDPSIEHSMLLVGMRASNVVSTGVQKYVWTYV